MMNYNLLLTTNEINLIFKALGERPFQEVFELMGKINEQVNAQINSLSEDENQADNE
jgi:hypothetical protein